VLYAAAITMFGILIIYFLDDNVVCREPTYIDLVFECISAFGTVGLGMGITTH
jgi:Trk-type K+ transport system membrane component